MLLSPNQIDLIHATNSSLWAGCSATSSEAEVIRLSGAQVDEDHLHIALFVPELYSRLFFRFIKENPKLTLLCSSLFTFETIQVKGKCVGAKPCTAEEIAYQKEYLAEFSRIAVAIGIRAGAAYSRYLTKPVLAIQMKAEEVYDQTPKIGAGRKIS